MNAETRISRRSTQSHNAILDATLKLLGSSGYVDFSIEKVANEAGVGKQTIYRWWSNRAELVLEVWRDRLLPPPPRYDVKQTVGDYLEESLYTFGRQISRTDCRQAAICVLAEAHRDPDLYQRMEEAVYAPRIKLITDAIMSAQDTGSFPRDVDINVLIDTLYGAVWYKVLIRFEKVTRAYIKKLVSQVLDESTRTAS